MHCTYSSRLPIHCITVLGNILYLDDLLSSETLELDIPVLSMPWSLSMSYMLLAEGRAASRYIHGKL